MTQVVLRDSEPLGMTENQDDENNAKLDVEANDRREKYAWYQLGGTAPFKTAASYLLPTRVDPPPPTPQMPIPQIVTLQNPCPELDPDLRRLICQCTAVARGDRPRLADQLLPEVKKAIAERDAAYYEGVAYCDGANETDDAVLRFLERVLGLPPPPAAAAPSPDQGTPAPPPLPPAVPNPNEAISSPPVGEDFSSPPLGTSPPTGTPSRGRFTARARDRREASPDRSAGDSRSRYRQRDNYQ